ncbi:MAG: hypothetical protein A3E82_02205 [Gammaproteobacteria bacterium RIFCSPHIGHO2_12_FULL_38_11]|nr:MAG: hypothetical protein A3E82_02205 [Gammaproteobacteria bacterium RIFCSPHIGHO2_12_FULL_38_11]
MQRRNKLALALFVIMGIYTILPFCFGIIAKHYTKTFLQHENKTIGNVLNINVKLVQYDRRWFHSTAIMQLERKTEDGSFEIIKKIPVLITHGPIYIFNGRVKTGFAVIKSQLFSIDPQSPFQAYFHENIGFAGEHAAFIFSSEKTKENEIAPFHVDSFQLSMNSKLDANKFHFFIDAHGLHFQDPKKAITVTIRRLKSTLLAQYLSDQHWALTWGIDLKKNQLTTVMPGNESTMLTLNTDNIKLANLHFDTKKMALVANEMVELKQATDSGQSIKATAWMALFQQLLTQVIQKDTTAMVSGLSVSTPVGQLIARYNVSFPTLPDAHDYFDVATHNVGNLQVDVPQWTYTDLKNNTLFSLKKLHYSENNNTVFSRNSTMTLGSFNIQDTQSTSKTPILAVNALFYQGELNGDATHLSQTMHWKLADVCFSDGCFNQIHGKLELLNMNFNAFRTIALATQQIVQYNPQKMQSMRTRWMDLANAYAKLISPETKIVLTHDMTTPEGNVSLQGDLLWPNLNVNTAVASDVNALMGQAVYEFRLLFPAVYVNAFLADQKKTMMAKNPAADAKEPSFETQTADFLQYAILQGYLKKVGDAYTVDLTGKGDAITVNGIAWKAPYSAQSPER